MKFRTLTMHARFPLTVWALARGLQWRCQCTQSLTWDIRRAESTVCPQSLSLFRV